MSDLWPQVGSYLGHYRLIEKLDEGGMGAVYKAHEAALDRFVAVKVLSPEMAQDAEFVHSFLREARAVAAMNHPNIIQIYFIGQHDDYIYFAMELIEGHALDRLAKAGPKPPTAKEWLAYMRQAAVGLQYAHNHGVIHRDIKPANLILNELGLVKVADFGLARKTGSGQDSTLAAADAMGTPEYMSPEEAAGEKVDHRSDIYSLGATLYHLLAGRPPYSGASGTEIMMHQIHTPLPPLRKANAHLPQPVCTVVEKCMAKLPDERFQSYDQLIRAIDDVLHGRAAATRVSVPQGTSAATLPPPKKQRSGPGAFVWLLILAILGAAGFGIWQISESQKKNRLQPLPPPQEEPVVQPPEEPDAPPVTHGPEPTPGAVTPPPLAAGRWVPLDLSLLFNRDVITRKPDGATQGLVSDGSGTLMTLAAKRLAKLPGPGLPDDGMVIIPGSEPPGRFRVNVIRGNDVICLSGADGKYAQPVSVALPAPLQQRYSSMAFLTAGTYGRGTIHARLRYAEGEPQTVVVRVYDVFGAQSVKAHLQDGSKSALDVQPKDKDFLCTLSSQVVPVDPSRVLQGVTLTFGGDVRPSSAGGDAARFLASVFAISAQRAEAAPGAAGATEVKPAPAVPARLTTGGALNVVQLPRDVVHGTWSIRGDALECAAEDGQPALLEIPVVPSPHFEVRADFTPQSTGGTIALAVSAPAGDFVWVMKTDDNQWWGIEGPHGGVIAGPQNPLSARHPAGLKPGTRHQCVLQMRGDELTVIVDGEKLGASRMSEWKNMALHRFWQLPKSRGRIGIGAFRTAVAFHSVILHVLPPGAAVPAPAATNATAAPPAQPPATAPAANFKDVADPIARLLAATQFETAQSEVLKLDATATPAQKPVFAALEKDTTRLLALKQRTADGISARSGRSVSFQMRNGSRIESLLASADMNEIKLRKQLPGGFAETKVRWLDVMPTSLLPVFAGSVDIKNGGELYDYGLLLFYQALYQQVRPEDAKRALATAAATDAALKDDAAQRAKWLDEWLSPAGAAEGVQPVVAEGVRVERGVAVTAGPSRWNWQCLDISAACNADIIYTESRAATDEFATGLGVGWTTAGWLTRNNIAGDFNGIPDDGRVMLADNDPRLCFSITMPPRRSAILLTADGGRQPKPVRLDLPAELRQPYRQISLLHAASFGDAAVNVDLVFADGSIQNKRIQTLDWHVPSRTRNLTPDQFAALATRSNKITNMNRFEMVAEIVSADREKKLAAIILSYDAERTAARGAADPRTTAAIFAISVTPAP